MTAFDKDAAAMAGSGGWLVGLQAAAELLLPLFWCLALRPAFEDLSAAGTTTVGRPRAPTIDGTKRPSERGLAWTPMTYRTASKSRLHCGLYRRSNAVREHERHPYSNAVRASASPSFERCKSEHVTLIRTT